MAIKNKHIFFFIIIMIVVLLDQCLKIWVFKNMQLYGEKQIPLLSWFLDFKYIINPGLINGIKIDSEYFKIIFSVLRLATIMFIIYFYLKKIEINKLNAISLGLIAGGGLGNTIDWIFHSRFLYDAIDGCQKWFEGDVIDMLRFHVPDFIPFIGGKMCNFIFNIADIAIIIGAILLLFAKNKKRKYS